MEAIKNEDGTWDILGVEDWNETFMMMCLNLRSGINFKFARYGDGEINCMNGKLGNNCDKHQYFPDLGATLHDALGRAFDFNGNARYMVGIQPLSVKEQMHYSWFGPGHVHRTFYNADVLHNASIRQMIPVFIDTLSARRVIIVGPQHLEPLAERVRTHWNFVDHIAIPDVDCWKSYKLIRERMISVIELNAVFLLCASMMSEVLIDFFRNAPVTMIDIGSVFDPYVGKFSRSYHHKKESWSLNKQ